MGAIDQTSNKIDSEQLTDGINVEQPKLKISKKIAKISSHQSSSRTTNNYIVKKHAKYDEIGMASWYGIGDGFEGKRTASGDRYRRNALSAAHKRLPMHSLVKVTNLNNKKSVILMINDRMHEKNKRVIDVSARSASIIGMLGKGSAKVKISFLPNETHIFRSYLKQKKTGRKQAEGYLMSLNNIEPRPVARKVMAKSKQNNKYTDNIADSLHYHGL